METSWLRLTLCQLMLPSQAWSRLAQAGVMGLVLGLPRLPDTSHWQIIETAAAGGDGGLVMAAVHSGGSILYSPLSVVTLTIITQLININHSSGAMINQEQMNIPSWPGFGLITFNSTIRCFIWSVSPADISQSPSSLPAMVIMRRWWGSSSYHLCCPHLAEERRLELFNFYIDVQKGHLPAPLPC